MSTPNSAGDERDPDVDLVVGRLAADSGTRISLDDVISKFGFSREELERELDADIAAGHG
jgi:hypothetical protein